jgi:hypothetical protein
MEPEGSWPCSQDPAQLLGPCVTLRNKTVFYGEELLAPLSNPQSGASPLVGCPRLHIHYIRRRYEGVSKSFRTGRLEREMQMVELSFTRCSCIAILWDSLVSFAAITLCVVSQQVFVVVVYFVIDSVRKLLDTFSYCPESTKNQQLCVNNIIVQ